MALIDSNITFELIQHFSVAMTREKSLVTNENVSQFFRKGLLNSDKSNLFSTYSDWMNPNLTNLKRNTTA